MSGFVKNLVRASNAGTVSSLTSSALGVAMAAGNGIIAVVKTSNAMTVTSFTDTQGNVYTLDCQSPAAPSGRVASLFSCLAPSAPLGATDTCTANLSGPSAGTAICLAEYAGLVANDQVGRNSNAGSVTSGSVTLGGGTSTPSEVVIVALAWSGAVTAITATAPLVLRNGGTNLTSGLVALLDDTLLATGTPTEAFSWTTGAAYAAAMASYTLAGAAPAAPSSVQYRNIVRGGFA